jgi:hypothetical protein
MESLDEHDVKFSDEVHKESADTFVHELHPAHVPATATPTTTTDAAHKVSIAGVPLVERYGHPV